MVEGMTGEQPNFMLKICWFVISPAILVTLICLSVYDMASIEGVYSAWQPLKVCLNLQFRSKVPCENSTCAMGTCQHNFHAFNWN